jgi:hypothetical protein
MRPLAVNPDRPRSPHFLWKAACAGRVPAEVLPVKDREDLIWDLHELGWTDVEIAAHTMQTSYTVGRIRERLGLSANRPQTEGARWTG